MAPATLITDERRLLGELGHALEALEETAGVKARVVALEHNVGKDRGADAVIDIYIEGKKHRYLVEAKTNVDRLAAVGHLKAQLDRWGKRGLLFAPYITSVIAKQCRKLGVAFLDIAGNAFLHERGLHVFITGEKRKGIATTTMGARGGGTATALRVVFVILCNEELLNAPYRNIVDAANVALGAVGWVFLDLEGRGYIAGRQKKHNRRFLDATRLFDEWVTNYPVKLRHRLNPRRFRAENPDWWKTADLTDLRACWGGEIAAHRLTKYLKPATCTVYIEPDENQADATRTGRLTRLVATNRLRADPQGEVEILDAFWRLPPVPNYTDVVPPILAYADLVTTPDPRNLEAAKLIRERYIDGALHKT